MEWRWLPSRGSTKWSKRRTREFPPWKSDWRIWKSSLVRWLRRRLAPCPDGRALAALVRATLWPGTAGWEHFCFCPGQNRLGLPNADSGNQHRANARVGEGHVGNGPNGG